MNQPIASPRPPSAAEAIKRASRALRGDIAAELASPAPQVSEATYTLLKFHGTYEQYDRDTAPARKAAKQEKDWQFMVRVRAPGGRLTAAQYLALDALADRVGDHTLRLTTRQGVQFHGVAKADLKPTIAGINATLLTTLAACGDVVRNVTTTPAPVRDAVHARLQADARLLSGALLPRGRAHHEIFLAEDAEAGGEEADPLYGDTYLPRKFKIGIAHPADNTVDVFTNDLGLIAVFTEDGELLGYNVAVGGGMGMTHGKPATFPRLASVVGSVGPDQLVDAARAVVALQRDHGDRSDRKHARLKYVVAERGHEWVRQTLAARYALHLAAPLPHPPFQVPDHLGWHGQGDGLLWLGLPVMAGRIADAGGVPLRTALRQAVSRFGINPVVTPQQDLLLADVRPADRAPLQALLRDHGVALAEDLSALARSTIACVSLPTCGQALAEAERIRAPLVAALDAVLARHGLSGTGIGLRISGCANGCARPYGGEVGIVGRTLGHYALFVGGDVPGTRLSFQVADRVALARIPGMLEPLLARYATESAGEGFGDFCNRLGQAQVRLILAGDARQAAD